MILPNVPGIRYWSGASDLDVLEEGGELSLALGQVLLHLLPGVNNNFS